MTWQSATATAVATLILGACGATPPTAPDASTLDPAQPPPAGVPTEGRFVGVGHEGQGTASLVVAEGRARLVFSSDFVVTQTPGPYVYLNTANDPNRGQPLRVAALKSSRGAQQYDFMVPAGVRYTYVLIWCDPFNVPVAEAPIAPTP